VKALIEKLPILFIRGKDLPLLTCILIIDFSMIMGGWEMIVFEDAAWYLAFTIYLTSPMGC